MCVGVIYIYIYIYIYIHTYIIWNAGEVQERSCQDYELRIERGSVSGGDPRRRQSGLSLSSLSLFLSLFLSLSLSLSLSHLKRSLSLVSPRSRSRSVPLPLSLSLSFSLSLFLSLALSLSLSLALSLPLPISASPSSRMSHACCQRQQQEGGGSYRNIAPPSLHRTSNTARRMSHTPHLRQLAPKRLTRSSAQKKAKTHAAAAARTPPLPAFPQKTKTQGMSVWWKPEWRKPKANVSRDGLEVTSQSANASTAVPRARRYTFKKRREIQK